MSKRSEGFFEIDHSNSPGIDAETARLIGRNAQAVGEGQTFRTGVKVCVHCGTPVLLRHDRERKRNYCRQCDDYVCDNPKCNDPAFHVCFSQIMDEMVKDKNIPVLQSRKIDSLELLRQTILDEL